MIREVLREELAKRPLKESSGYGEYAITYRLTSWPKSYSDTELYLDAESIEDARERFLDYMFDPDSYDAGDYMPVDEDEIKILDIKATGR